jgi:hypothetical protein
MSKLIAKLIFALIKLVFSDKTDLVLENLALRHQLEVLKRKKSQNLKNQTASFGPGYHNSGQAGNRPLFSLHLKLSSNGIEKTSSYTGDGNADINRADQRYQKRSEG